MARPKTKRIAARRKIGPSRLVRGTPAAMRLPNDSVMETPTIHRNAGNTVSVKVHPCHAEWLSGAYDLGPPALFTITIRAMVAPRRASSATRRGCDETGTAAFADSGFDTVAKP